MSDVVHPDSLNWTYILLNSSCPPSPFFGRRVDCLVPVILALAAGVAIWFWGYPALLLGHQLVDRVDQIPAIVEEQPQPRAFQIPLIPAIAVDEQPHTQGLQIPPIPATAVGEQLPEGRTVHIWDPSQVIALIRAIHDYIEPQIPRSTRQARKVDSDYDSDASSSSDERWEYVRYPSLDKFETDARLLVPDSMAQLQQMLCLLPVAQHQETIARACQRFWDVHENLLIIHVDPKAFSGPGVLSETNFWMKKLKITAKVCCLMWHQLGEQNQQFYPNLKEACFEEVAGQLIDNVLNIASLFSDAMWSGSCNRYMLPTFDTLVEVIHDIQQISASRSETTLIKVIDIYCSMVNKIKGIFKDKADDSCMRNEFSMHPTTYFIIQALQFVNLNSDRLQSVLAPGDCPDVHNLWILKLEEVAGINFKNEKAKQHIFMINNAWFAWQNMCCSSSRTNFSEEQVERLNLLKEKYINIYIDQVWTPCLKYPSTRRRRPSSRKFYADFISTCENQREFTVLTEPKNILRSRIIELGTDTDGICSLTSRKPTVSICFWKKPKNNTVKAFENDFNVVFKDEVTALYKR